MASILDRYGIKEVADVTFYELKDGKPSYPVLFLDTLKVSTIEQTAETADARGGKGNPKLISWDYGKEITVTLEDALFSARSMAIMFGNGKAASLAADTASESSALYGLIMKTEDVSNNTEELSEKWTAPNGKEYKRLNPLYYDETGASSTVFHAADDTAAEPTYKKSLFATYDLAVKKDSASVITISANSFPGTYYVTGDTFARSEKDGKDEFFQFVIPKAKITSENTITLEAEGDPSVFNMNLTVLRPDGGNMMYLVKYDLDGDEAPDPVADIFHNHELVPVTTTTTVAPSNTEEPEG